MRSGYKGRGDHKPFNLYEAALQARTDKRTAGYA